VDVGEPDAIEVLEHLAHEAPPVAYEIQLVIEL